MKRNLLLPVITVIALYSLRTLAAGPWIELREAYNSASEQNELALCGAYNFDNGAGIMLTNAYSTG